MTRQCSFVDCFWETDFNGTLGFDLLCKRIKDGHKTCKDIEDFLKRKAKADLQYSKSLRILARSVEGKEDPGELGCSWQELKFQTERMARFHEDTSVEHNKLADEIARFSESFKVQTKQMEDKVKDSQKMKRITHAKLVDLQRLYQEKCREMLLQENQLNSAKQNVTSSTRDLEKLKVRADKSREAMEKADIAYRQTVDVLEHIRRDWELDTQTACELYQRQEEERIYFLRDCLWRCTNIGSQLCVDCDESCDSVRTCLEKCDVEADIHEFVKNNMTGKHRPVPIVYESYFEATPSSKRRDARASPLNTRRKPPPPTSPLPAIPVQANTSSAEYSTIYSVAK